MLAGLRRKVPGEEFDYTFLINHLEGYANPRNKITALLQSGDIIRVKKGLYVFGENHRLLLVSPEVLANLIFGPSYVSLEYALGFHGLIPERVEEITSVTSKRSRTFDTPFGRFSYHHLHRDKVAVGVERIAVDHIRHCLMASPEKALADLLATRTDIQTTDELAKVLEEDLRLAPKALRQGLVREISSIYRNPRVRLLAQFVGAI